MVSAADIPPELFSTILYYIADDTELGNLWSNKRKTVIAHLAACSLTCVYWAKICRPRIFMYVVVKSFDALQRLSSLASHTPQSLSPIVNFIQYLHMVQYLNDRPWLHTLRLQPSLGLQPSNLGNLKSRYVHIIGPGSVSRDSRHTILPILWTLFPARWECNAIGMSGLHLRSLNDIRRWLRPVAFAQTPTNFTFTFQQPTIQPFIQLSKVTWETHVHDPIDAVFSNRPFVLPFLDIFINVQQCTSNTELAWATLTRVTAGSQTHDGIKYQMPLSECQILLDISNMMQDVLVAITPEKKDASKLRFNLSSYRLQRYHDQVYVNVENDYRRGNKLFCSSLVFFAMKVVCF
jgi:hypothetical protein